MLFINEKGLKMITFSFMFYFCLAIIGSPKFNFEMRNEERKIILNIEGIPTAVYDAQKRQLTVQDIFQNDLQYKVTYSKAKSSGKVRDDIYLNANY